jgi:LacI family transcriptional regulator
MVNIREVARAAGVSTATVSRYFAGQTVRNHETISRTVADLGYLPSPLARSLKSGRHHAIGVIVPDIANPFFAGLVKGIEAEARSRGYEIILGNTDEDARHERALVASIAQRSDGLIIAPVLAETSSLFRLGDLDIPLVLVDRDVLPDASVDRVLVDNEAGAALAVDHLVSLGHERIGFISGPLDSTPGRGRYEGFLQALRQHGLDAGAEYGAEYIRVGDFREEGGYRAMTELLALPDRRRPTAVFGASNLLTLGALRALNDHGVSVPGQLSVIGFDDLSFAPLLNPPLTVIRRPEIEQGATAARLLFGRLGRDAGAEPLPGQRISLPVELVVRGSTAAPESAAPEPAAPDSSTLQPFDKLRELTS